MHKPRRKRARLLELLRALDVVRRRVGLRGATVLGALAGLSAAAALLDRYGGGADVDALLAYARAARTPPDTLIFMGGYHGLRSGRAELRVGGGGQAVPVTWLGTRLHARLPLELYTMLVDGAPQPTHYGEIASYGATRVFDIFHDKLPDLAPPFALHINERFDFLDDPIYASAGPGLTLEILPHDYRLRDVADAYIYLGTARGTEPVK